MSRRHFSLLLVVALVLAAAVALLLPGKTGQDLSGDGPFFKNLGQRVNEVNSLIVTMGQGAQPIHLDRNEQAWTIRELSGFPADWIRLRELLTALAEADVIEPKTSNTQYYSRLGVEDITDPGAKSVLLQLGLPNETIGVLIGNGESSGRGHYVRMEGSEQSYLIDKELNISAEAIEWADREIIDIGSALVAELRISHPDGDRIVIRKISADDTDFLLDGVPEGRSTRSAWTVNSLANSFSMLRMEGVLPDSGASTADSAAIMLLSFSGLEISAGVFQQDGMNWVRLGASAPDSNADLQEEANAINRNVNGWIFQIPTAKYESMTKTMEDLLEPPE